MLHDCLKDAASVEAKTPTGKLHQTLDWTSMHYALSHDLLSVYII